MAVTAILLAAGYATRLYPLTKDRPKALLPLVGKRMILDAVLDSLRGIPDITRRILVTNHRFAEQFQTWRDLRQAEIEILDDGTENPETRIGAIRDLELARTQGSAEGDLLVLGTDNLFSRPLGEFVKHAQRRRPTPSIALGQVPSKEMARQCGVVACDGSSRIRAFVEKPTHPPSTLVALCLYYFPEPMCGRIPQFLQEGGNADAPGYFIGWLIQRVDVYGVPIEGAWFDIGSPATYEAAITAWPTVCASAAEGRLSPRSR